MALLSLFVSHVGANFLPHLAHINSLDSTDSASYLCSSFLKQTLVNSYYRLFLTVLRFLLRVVYSTLRITIRGSDLLNPPWKLFL